MSNKAKVYPQYNGVNPKYVEARNKCNEVVTYKGNCSDIKEPEKCCRNCKFWMHNAPDAIERKIYFEEHKGLIEYERKLYEKEIRESPRRIRDERNDEVWIDNPYENEMLNSELEEFKKRGGKPKDEFPVISQCIIWSYFQDEGVRNTSQLGKCKSFKRKENVDNG